MKILHINASDCRGGAALAVWRLHQGLRKINIHSHLLVRNKYSTDHSVTAIASEGIDDAREFCDDIIHRVYYHNRSDISNTHFSLPLVGIDLSQHPLVKEADVIHLHWVASFQTPMTIQALLATKKPIIWTLHDLAPFTGGCHFSAGCQQFQSACTSCPQYLYDPFNIPQLVFRAKQTLWTGNAFSLVAPSHWMAEQAKQSALFGSMPISVIPNAIDSTLFQPSSPSAARIALGIAKEPKYILCGADQSREKRKGFAILSRVLAACFANPAWQDTKILWVGEEPPEACFIGLPLISLGRLHNQEQMAQACVAADMFILPSVEDNLPNMVLEALSCGIPVIAFDVGGMRDVIKNGEQGYLSPPDDEQAMIQNILALLSSPAKRKSMSAHCRSLIDENFKDSHIAEQYLKLYQGVLEAAKGNEKVGHLTVNTEEGEALNQLLPKLTRHCLQNEIKNLQHQLKTLQEDHKARLADIQQLHLQNQRLLQKPYQRFKYAIKRGIKYLLDGVVGQRT